MQLSGFASEDVSLALSRAPDGQISERFGLGLRSCWSKTLQKSPRAKTNFASRFNVIWVVQSAREK